jgi:hypothetical protein
MHWLTLRVGEALLAAPVCAIGYAVWSALHSVASAASLG